MNADTIAAIATAPGAGGIAIVRVSGPDAEAILRRMFRRAGGGGAPQSPTATAPHCDGEPVISENAPSGRRFESHRLMYGHVTDADGEVLDEVMAVLMRAPRTYTREDVAEIHCHGGRVSAQMVLNRALALGARVAEPGEFTRRAFMNGRIDLSRAEAVMQLIGANSAAAARASVRQLDGGVSGFVRQVSDRLTDLMALIEASTDFPDEVEEEAAAAQVVDALNAEIREIEARCDARGARLLREGASVVLVGSPNVGKSSLMNALLRQERAIVTDIPGTTRDVLTERVSLGGVLVELSDTAGQRDTQDPVERIGVDRARQAARGADVTLIVVDAGAELSQEDERLVREADAQSIVCLNKSDLPPVLTVGDIRAMTDAEIMSISAHTGEGMDALTRAIAARVDVGVIQEGLLVTERHIGLARQAADALGNARAAIEAGMPLDTAAIDVRAALEALGQITGENATEAVIDRVFATFCVGK